MAGDVQEPEYIDKIPEADGDLRMSYDIEDETRI